MNVPEGTYPEERLIDGVVGAFKDLPSAVPIFTVGVESSLNFDAASPLLAATDAQRAGVVAEAHSGQFPWQVGTCAISRVGGFALWRVPHDSDFKFTLSRPRGLGYGE